MRWSPGLLQLPGTLQRGRGGRQTENISQVGRCGEKEQVKFTRHCSHLLEKSLTLVGQTSKPILTMFCIEMAKHTTLIWS